MLGQAAFGAPRATVTSGTGSRPAPVLIENRILLSEPPKLASFFRFRFYRPRTGVRSLAFSDFHRARVRMAKCRYAELGFEWKFPSHRARTSAEVHLRVLSAVFQGGVIH